MVRFEWSSIEMAQSNRFVILLTVNQANFNSFPRYKCILSYIPGVLFEMTKREGELPWCITIHFSKFPEDVLFRCPNRYLRYIEQNGIHIIHMQSSEFFNFQIVSFTEKSLSHILCHA